MRKSALRNILILLAILSVALVARANPDNYLTNPSFTDNIDGWAVGYDDEGVGSVAYDGTYHEDGAGSLKGTSGVAKADVMQGYASSTIETSINSDDTVTLSLQWSKLSKGSGASDINTIKAQIQKPATTTWTTIWEEVNPPPVVDVTTTWAGPSAEDVSSYFTETGTYKFRWYFDLKSGNANGAETIAWIDSTALDVTVAGAEGITISGTVFNDEGNTSSTEGATVHLVIDSTSTTTTIASTTDGSYSFTNVTQPSTSSAITVYLDNSTSTGVTVTRYSGSGNVTGLDIYRHRIIVRHEDSGPITISDLAKYDSDDDGDILFTAASSTGTLTASSTSEFYVWSGKTFGSWGDGGVGGEISLDCVDINATFTATSTQTIEVSCSANATDTNCWDATGGTFTSASSKVRFISTAGGKTITTGGTSNPFYDIEFDGSGGGWTFDTGDHKVSNNFTITTGSVTASSGTLQVGGNWSNLDTFSHGDGTVTFNDTTGSKTIDGGSSAFYTLTFDGTGGGWQLSTSTLDIDDSLNLTNGTLDASSQDITLAKDLTISSGFIFTKGSGTFKFDGADTHTWTDSTTTDMGAVAINGATETITLASDVKATALKIWSGNTFDAGSYTFTIAGSGTGASKPFIVEGSFDASTSIAQYTGTSTVDVASTTYYNLKFDQSSGTFQLSGDTTTTNDVNIAAGTFDATVANYNLAVGGNWTNDDTFTCQNGTVTFYASSTTSTFVGDTTFFHFTCETASKVLEFTDGTAATTTVTGNLILDGSDCGTQIKLRSVSSPNQWYIDATTTASTTIDYVDIKDSYAVKPLTAENSTDSGNSGDSNWTINEGVCATSLTQKDYRWYANIDNITPTTALDSTNTAITNATSGTVFRIRMNISVTNLEFATGTKAFKLQYATTTYLGDCTSTLGWGDVGATSSAETWRGYDNGSAADGDTVTALKLDTSEIKESYEEANNSTSNPATIPVDQEGEWDWVVQFNAAYSTTTYCFKMVESDGSVLNGYTNYPKITSYGPASWMEVEDATTTVSADTYARLRFLIVNTGSAAAADYNYQIEYATRTDATCGDETFVSIPELPDSGPFEMATSSYFRRGDSTTHRLNDPGAYTFIAGELVEDPYSTTGALTLNNDIYTEVEYKFHVTANAGDGYYCFRVTNDGAGLDSYDTYAILQVGEPGITIAGTAMEHDENTSTTSGTVRVAVNDALQSETGTISDGSWSIASVTVSSDDVVTVWVDGAVTSSRAVAVTKYDGDGNIGGMLLYERHLTIGSDDNQTITNANLSQYDNSVSSDADIFHDVVGTALTVDAGSGFTDEELYIKADNIFAPDGNANTCDIDIQGTFTASSTETHTIGGSWANNATFTAASSTVQFTATSTGKTITTNSQHFYALTFDGSGGGWTFAAGNDHYINNNFTITNGVVTSTNGTLEVKGNWEVGASGTFNATSGTVAFKAADTGHTINPGSSSFNVITFDNSTGGWTITAHATSTGNWNMTNASSFAATSSITIEVKGNYVISDSIPSVITWNSGSVLYLNSGSSYTIGSKTQNAEIYSILQIGDSTDIRVWNSTSTTSTVDSSGSLYSQDHNDVTGSLYVWGDSHTTSTDYWSYNTDFNGSDISGSPRQCQVVINSTTSITIDSEATLEIKGGGGGASETTTVSYSPGSGSWNLNNESGSGMTFQEAAIGYMKVATGTVTVLNTVLNNEAVPTAGAILNADWYLGVHAVMFDSTTTNATNSTTTISEHSTASQSTIWKWSGGGWGASATSQVTHTDGDGKIPQPGNDNSIRIREYKKEGATTTYYKYNLEIDAASFSDYDYFDDQGEKYISSTSSAAGDVDTCIFEGWQRNDIDVNNAEPAINDPPDYGTWYIGLSSDLEFGVSSLTVDLGTLDGSNDYTATATTTLYVTTTAPAGYAITAYDSAGNDGKLSSTSTSSTIARWSYDNDSPATWTASNYGFGYTTDDNDLAGGTTDRFATSTRYAGFTSSTEEVADRAHGNWQGATTTITYKVSVSTTQEAATYQTTIKYICTANY